MFFLQGIASEQSFFEKHMQADFLRTSYLQEVRGVKMVSTHDLATDATLMPTWFGEPVPKPTHSAVTAMRDNAMVVFLLHLILTFSKPIH